MTILTIERPLPNPDGTTVILARVDAELFCEVSNLSKVHQHAVSQTTTTTTTTTSSSSSSQHSSHPLLANVVLLNPNLILSPPVLIVALQRALLNLYYQSMKTKSLASEIMYHLFPSTSITKAISLIGLNSSADSVLALRITPCFSVPHLVVTVSAQLQINPMVPMSVKTNSTISLVDDDNELVASNGNHFSSDVNVLLDNSNDQNQREDNQVITNPLLLHQLMNSIETDSSNVSILEQDTDLGQFILGKRVALESLTRICNMPAIAKLWKLNPNKSVDELELDLIESIALKGHLSTNN